eukprot:scaffold3596_cov316-Prasinococcus_capsulatus_cf.AAC.8
MRTEAVPATRALLNRVETKKEGSNGEAVAVVAAAAAEVVLVADVPQSRAGLTHRANRQAHEVCEPPRRPIGRLLQAEEPHALRPASTAAASTTTTAATRTTSTMCAAHAPRTSRNRSSFSVTMAPTEV